MFRFRFFSFLLLTSLIACSFSHEASAADVKALLKEADAYRITAESLRVDTEVKTFKGGQPDKTRLYHVYVKPGRRSLVVFRSPSERGQKMLMLGDDFWLVMPSSQRPLRITPMQKLLGDASTGDIASLTCIKDPCAGVSCKSNEFCDPTVGMWRATARRVVESSSSWCILRALKWRQLPIRVEFHKRAVLPPLQREGNPDVVPIGARPCCGYFAPVRIWTLRQRRCTRLA
jgi:hypothetical protein